MVYARNTDLGLGVGGSGIPISKDWILTAGHVCDSIAELAENGLIDGLVSAKYLQDGRIKEVSGFEIIKYQFDETLDLCILFKENHGLEIASLTTNYDEIAFGDKIYVVGAPQVANNMPVDILNGKMLFSAPITSGNSGGPVFDRNGKIIGIAVMGNAAYHNINFAITALDIWRFILSGVEL
jgi:S1-C subfamily serine protease